MIIELGGRQGSVVRFLPPLIITEAQLDHVLDIFALAVKTAVQCLRFENQERHATDEDTLLVL